MDDSITSMLYARMLGGLTLAWDDRVGIAIPGSSTRSLLAYLITHRDRPHMRDLLTGLFWPDLPESAARRRLTQALWQIRTSLASHPALLTEGDTIRLDPALSLWLDVAEFEGHVSSGSAARAVDLYRGEFMAGYYDDWLLTERERLREVFLSAVEWLVKDCKARGTYQDALAHARRLAAEDPWREEIHCEVMRLCHLLGRNAEALKQYQVCRQVLTDELGVDPAPATEALAAEIAARAGLGELPWMPIAARPSIGPLLEHPERLPLVGRRTELAELVSQVDRAAQGEGGLTLVYGETGIGKTRLLQELAHNAQWRSIRCTWGHCAELTGAPAYEPLIQVLRADLPALRASSLEPLWRAELARLLPELSTGESPPPLAPEQEQRRLLEAIVCGFAALSAAAPCLVLLEDAHWMDPASLDGLRTLLPRLATMPLRIVLSVRSEELTGLQADALTALENTRLPRRIDLRRLDPDETAELVQRALDLEQPPARFAARLYAETEGNPFFVTEALRALVDENLLYRNQQGAWSTAWDESTEDYRELPLPVSVAQSIERRLNRLPAPLRESLALAAVIGRQVRFELWLQAGDLAERDLLAAGDELCRRGLFFTPGAADRDADYVFAHDQIRRVTYRQLAPPRRRLVHRHVAQALTELAPDEPGILAYHWSEAQAWDRAADAHQQAGDRARDVYANREAASHYTHALEALGRLSRPDDPARFFALHLAREAVYALLGERAQQAADLEAMGKWLAHPALDTPFHHIGVSLRRVAYYEATSDYPRALDAVREVAAQAALAHDTQAEYQAHLRWGRILHHCGDFEPALQHLDRAHELARAMDDALAQALSLNEMGALAFDRGEYGEALSRYQRALELAAQSSDQAIQASVHNNLGNVWHYLADYSAALADHHQALTLLRTMGDRRGEARSLYNLSCVYHDSGDDEAARRILEEVCGLAHAIGDRRIEGYGWVYLGLVLEGLGEFDASRDAYLKGLALRREVGLHALAIDALSGLARVATAQGDHAQALRYADEVLAWLDERGPDGVGDPCLAYKGAYKALLAAGQVERGATALRAAYRLLMTYADSIPDPARRHGYLHDIEPGRTIWNDYHGLGACRVQARLPRTGAPLRRALRDDETVEVAWTISAPEDEAVSGKAARRQQRLLRLLREAAEQGAVPAHQDLADALQVSLRTIERDVAALSSQGVDVPPTRGKMSA